jgi:catechol 2,3-dioxygenase
MSQIEQYGVRPPAYRLPDATRLGTVRLQVSNLERSTVWYHEVLGFRVASREHGLATLAPEHDGQFIELHERPGATPAPRRGRLGLYPFAILVPDRAALGRFVTHLAQVGERAGASDHLVSEALYLQDPDGLGIEVYADRPRSTWQLRGDELAMDTRPLDLESLTREARGQAWTGMPEGTVLGHVHLHVGDLAEASGFYHRALGLDVMVRSYPGALFLSAGGYHHHLGLNTWAGPAAQPPGADQARLLEWEILLPSGQDVAAVGQSLKGAGFAVNEVPGAVVADDPWGTTLRIRTAA